MCGSNEQSLLYLWNLRTLYIGPLFEEANIIIPAAATLIVALEDDMKMKSRHSDQLVRTRVALLPPGVAFGAETGESLIANLYLDPVGRDLQCLKPRMRACTDGIYHAAENEQELIAAFRDIHQQAPAPADTYRIMNEAVFSALPASFHHEVDPRIWQAIDYVKTHAIDNVSSETLADHVGMSEPQLRRAFKQATGIPLRRNRRWHRLFVTATMLATGMTLTDAALIAGFSDSSHFNHAFREMTGMKPSSLLRRKENTRIFIGQESGY